MTDVAVHARGLTKSFGVGETRVDAVVDVDFDFVAGEIVLIMGPSGSGKTTLLSMLGGLLRPSSGTIEVDGVDIATLDEQELPPFRARRFGFIFQDFNLLAALTAEENVAVALNLGGIRGSDAQARSQDLLQALGLEKRLSFSPEELSGGDKQRVAIARAVANNPAVVFADEPTANLDSAHGAETMRLLRQLAKEHGTTVVIVSHDQRLREIADRVLWLEDGRLKAMSALVRDPSCGMLIDPAQAGARLHTNGATFYFCSRGCMHEYEEKAA